MERLDRLVELGGATRARSASRSPPGARMHRSTRRRCSPTSPFDTDGYLILGIEDRTAHPGRQPQLPGTVGHHDSLRDVLQRRPPRRIPGWRRHLHAGEQRRRGHPDDHVGSGRAGPGRLEFFNDRQAIGTGAFHQEIGLGAIALPSRLVSRRRDDLRPARRHPGGRSELVVAHHRRGRGGIPAQSRRGGSATSTGTFQKAGGLGDIDVIALQAPLEIGNRVWFDGDRDGVQDADEPAAPGVTVELLQGTTVIGTTTTSASGEYYFSSTSIALLTPSGGAYTVRFTTPSTGSLYAAHPMFGTVAWNDVNFTIAERRPGRGHGGLGCRGGQPARRDDRVHRRRTRRQRPLPRRRAHRQRVLQCDEGDRPDRGDSRSRRDLRHDAQARDFRAPPSLSARPTHPSRLPPEARRPSRSRLEATRSSPRRRPPGSRPRRCRRRAGRRGRHLGLADRW